MNVFYLPPEKNNFSFQPVLHNSCNKCRRMCYPVCEMVLSDWYFTICSTPYNRKMNELSVSINKIK